MNERRGVSPSERSTLSGKTWTKKRKTAVVAGTAIAAALATAGVGKFFEKTEKSAKIEAVSNDKHDDDKKTRIASSETFKLEKPSTIDAGIEAAEGINEDNNEWQNFLEQFRDVITKSVGGKVGVYTDYEGYKKFNSGDFYVRGSKNGDGEIVLQIKRVNDLSSDKGEHQEYMDDDVAVIKKLPDGTYLVESGSRFTYTRLDNLPEGSEGTRTDIINRAVTVNEPYLLAQSNGGVDMGAALNDVVRWNMDYERLGTADSGEEAIELRENLLRKWGDKLDPAARDAIRGQIGATKSMMKK